MSRWDGVGVANLPIGTVNYCFATATVAENSLGDLLCLALGSGVGTGFLCSRSLDIPAPAGAIRNYVPLVSTCHFNSHSRRSRS